MGGFPPVLPSYFSHTPPQILFLPVRSNTKSHLVLNSVATFNSIFFRESGLVCAYTGIVENCYFSLPLKKLFSHPHNHCFTTYFHIQGNRITITDYCARSVGGDKVPEKNIVSMRMSLLSHSVSN